MSILQVGARALACASVLSCGCGQAPLGGESRCADIAPGDLVITEVLANPDGRDGSNEYVELFNASGGPLELDGLTIVAGKSDGTTDERHRFSDGTIDADDYFVVGNAIEGSKGVVDYSYGTDLGALRNSDGSVSLWCEGVLIDSMTYEQTTDGRALELDGRRDPDSQRNDDPTEWCTAPEEFADEGANVGTPGAANSWCETAVAEGGCLEDGELREPRGALPGEARITEWMANPTGTDAGYEWVEVEVTTAVDLAAIALGPAADALEPATGDRACVPVDAGSRVVFGASPAAAPRVDAVLGFSLGNDGARSIVLGSGGAVLDRVDYDGAVEGRSWQVDSTGATCLASLERPHAPDSYGTPGEPNPPCPPELGPGMCLDAGVPRPIVSPEPGEVRISEWMADPDAVGNREGEWLELRFSASVDLNGMALSDQAGMTTVLDGSACRRVEAGAHVVLARDLDPAVNGGVLDAVDRLTLSLNNQNETVDLRVGAEVIDSVSYAKSESGAATQVDELGATCTATTPYGAGDLGTPGSANPACF